MGGDGVFASRFWKKRFSTHRGIGGEGNFVSRCKIRVALDKIFKSKIAL
jgi:hypothetical protein